MAGSCAGAHSSASATPDKAPSASKQIESTANPLAAILGYEYVSGQRIIPIAAAHWQLGQMRCHLSRLPCRQDDSASEDGSEPPSPRHFAGPAPHTPDVNGNSEADKTGDEDDPMVMVHAMQLRVVHHMPLVASAYRLAVQHACLQLRI